MCLKAIDRIVKHTSAENVFGIVTVLEERLIVFNEEPKMTVGHILYIQNCINCIFKVCEANLCVCGGIDYDPFC